MFPGNTQISVYLQLTWDTLIRTYQVIKFKVLDMMDTRPFSTIDELDPVKNCFTQEKLEKFLSPDDEFNEENNLDYMICDNFLFSS